MTRPWRGRNGRFTSGKHTLFTVTGQSLQFQHTQLSVHSSKLLLLLQQVPVLSLGPKSHSAKLCAAEQRQTLLQVAYKPPPATCCLNVLCRNLHNVPLPHPDTPGYTREARTLGSNRRGALPGQASDLTLGQRLPNCPGEVAAPPNPPAH